MSVLSLTFWPNPVCRNHTGEMRWYFNVALRAQGTGRVQLYRYRGEWYDRAGQFEDSKEGALDIELIADKPLSFADLWVSSAIPQFTYRLTVFGRDENGIEIRAQAVLQCE